MLFPGGSRPTAKEQLCSISAPAKAAFGTLPPQAQVKLPGSPPGICTALPSLSPTHQAFYLQVLLLPRLPFGVIQDTRLGVKGLGVNLALALIGCMTLGKSFYL